MVADSLAAEHEQSAHRHAVANGVETDRQADRQTSRQAGRQTDRWEYSLAAEHDDNSDEQCAQGDAVADGVE